MGRQHVHLASTSLYSGIGSAHTEVPKGEMCGMNLATETKLQLEEGDRLQLYRSELKDRTL